VSLSVNLYDMVKVETFLNIFPFCIVVVSHPNSGPD
jgi:hypothetical protein